jgi:AraC family transcriptional regulator of adaptative response/methylated-DNA-[protein]-cysteine methyltransferase
VKSPGRRHAAARNTPEPVNLVLVDSPVGQLLLGASDSALHMLEFTDPSNVETRLESARRRFGSTAAVAGPSGDRASGRASALVAETRRQLDEYFAGTCKTFDLPLRYSGSPFQKRVWEGLLAIGYGRTLSYLELARRLGDEKSLRAVCQANGQNPIAIVIPCHRVINASGDIGGFGGGPARKRFLLELESREQRGQLALL